MLKRFIIKLFQTYLMLMVIPIGLGILIQLTDPAQGGLSVFKAFMMAPLFHITAIVFSGIVALIAVLFGGRGDTSEPSETSGFHDVGGSDGGAF